MVTFSHEVDGSVGIFFVQKKEDQLRLIVDCRPLNQRLRRPPRTHLASTAAFCEVYVPDGKGLFYSSHDVSDCFYQFRIPRALARFFGLLPVAASKIGVTRIDGLPVSPEELVYPLLTVLPMGFSFALHWAQQAHEVILRRGGFYCLIGLIC